MFSIAGFFKKQPNLYEKIITDIYDGFSELCKDRIPMLEDEIREYMEKAKKDLKENLDTNFNRENLEAFVLQCFKKLQEYSIPNDDIHNKATNLRDTNLKMIDTIYTEVDIRNYHSKLYLAKKYCATVIQQKKCIKALILGDTQQGKTSFVKHLFQISDDEIKTKGNTGSDTEDVTPHTIDKNGITFTFVDCPGFHDSRGPSVEKRNMQNIKKYIKNNDDIDVIFWVSKLDRLLDSAYSDIIKKFGKKFNDNIWSKCIVVLTCANSSPIPESYFPQEFFEEEDDKKIKEFKKNIWQNYVDAKKKMWKDFFINNIGDNVPVCLVENNKACVKMINGISVLKNGEPFWESLMYKVFKMVDCNKAPIAFMAMAKGNQTDKMDSHDKNLDVATTKYFDSYKQSLKHYVLPEEGKNDGYFSGGLFGGNCSII